MADRPLAAILTLGCKLNLADSEEIARGLGAAGFDVCDQMVEADAFVLNTCSVTHVADQKSRRLIRSARRLAPGAVVTVTGCYPQTAGSDRVSELGADFVTGTRDSDKDGLLSFITERVATRAIPGTPAARRSIATLHTRQFIKAQEGCNDVCAFCIVPKTRHREESRSIRRVIDEVNAAVERGAREVVITGTQLGAWGRDLDPPLKPHDLIGGILEETEIARLRFSSLQPQDISPELLALWHDPRLMPHFHLALQSGSDAVLTSMRRRYSADEYRDAAARIHAAVPGAAITTDVIAGFPGESDADFEATLQLCRDAGLARIHAFPYSARSGTVAAKMPQPLPPEHKKARMQELLALGRELASAHVEAHRGTQRPVLWEGQVQTPEGPCWHGYTDNYISIYASASSDLQNRITPVTIGDAFRDGARGITPGAAL